MSLPTTEALEALLRSHSLLDVREVLRAVMQGVGGPSGFGKIIADDLKDKGLNESNRIRLETAVLTALGNFGVEEVDTGDDLEQRKAVAAELLRRALDDQDSDDGPDRSSTDGA